MNLGVRTEEQELCSELHIARDAVNCRDGEQHSTKHGGFLSHLFEAFLRADRHHFELMRSIVRAVIDEYDLKCTCEPGSPDALTEAVKA